ncbi:MAG: DUF47 family protein [Chloroflexi bacterium]|nr:DUF47 family protein [Chloroflexota bacterium]
MPDFYVLVNEQCDVVVEGLEAFVEYMQEGTAEQGKQVRKIEHRGDELKARNIDILNTAFATPMDREDIYRAIVTVDQALNYAKTTVREMEILDLKPDHHMLEMAILLQEGAEALQRGYRKLSTTPALAEEDALAARKAERRTEKTYRRAIADLFRLDEHIQSLKSNEEGSGAKALLVIVDIFKRREIYRHISNGADRIAEAGESLHDIIVKIS